MSKTITTAATPPSPPRPMTEAQIEAAAHADPDAQPLTKADMATMPRIPRAKTLRRALGLTQEEFATRYQIPLGTLRDWEQGRANRTNPPEPTSRQSQATPRPCTGLWTAPRARW